MFLCSVGLYRVLWTGRDYASSERERERVPKPRPKGIKAARLIKVGKVPGAEFALTDRKRRLLQTKLALLVSQPLAHAV